MIFVQIYSTILGRMAYVEMTTVPDVGEGIAIWSVIHKVVSRQWRIDIDDENTVYCEMEIGAIV